MGDTGVHWDDIVEQVDGTVFDILFGGQIENLDGEAVDNAVRVAREKYEAIAETKAALSRAGVDVGLLELTSREVNTLYPSRILLVKDLADCVSKSDLVDIFGEFGALDKVIRPPTNTFALVIFVDPVHARIGHRYSCFKLYKGKPLLLEFLAEGILGEGPLSESDLNNVVAAIEYDAKTIPLEHLLEAAANFGVDPNIILSRSVLVSHLGFITSDKELRRHFTDHIQEGRILSSRILRRMIDGKRKSRGLALMELDSENTAVRVCKNLQGTNLNGKALKLRLANDRESEIREAKQIADKVGASLRRYLENRNREVEEGLLYWVPLDGQSSPRIRPSTTRPQNRLISG